MLDEFFFVPLAEGVVSGDVVTGTKDHADYWEELRAEGLLAALPQDKTVFEQDLHYRDLSDAEWQGLWWM